MKQEVVWIMFQAYPVEEVGTNDFLSDWLA